jgi:hypothetical protein
MSDYSKEIEIFNASVEGKANLSYIVRDSDLQRDALAELSALAAQVEDWKKRAISAQDENCANLFLGCECVIEALSAELDLWLQLKDGQPDGAWSSLVNAQMATRDAVRAHEGFSHLEARAARLVNIERVIFPDQVFLSAGLIVRRQECSICNAEYGDCPHLVGMPYMGEFCRCILHDIEADHIAMVKEPANKQCRIVYFNSEGGKRNRMTWRVEPGAIDDRGDPDRKGLMTSGILLATSDVGAKRGRK